MNRRNFFKNLGIAVAAIAVSKPILEALAAPETITGEWITYQMGEFTVHEKPAPWFFQGVRVAGSPLESFRICIIDDNGKLIELDKPITKYEF